MRVLQVPAAEIGGKGVALPYYLSFMIDWLVSQVLCTAFKEFLPGTSLPMVIMLFKGWKCGMYTLTTQ